jgi:hypothetical protein
MSRFAIMRIAKVKQLSQIDAISKHMERDRETPNADPERTPLNERLAGSGDWRADVQSRLEVAPTIRKNAVISIELLLGASPEWWTTGTEAEQDRRRDAWRDLSTAWLRDTFGEQNLVAAVVHRDELVSHIHALVVPIDERGRLSAWHFIGGDRSRLSELQDSYAAKVAVLGLERGVRGSVATHEEVKRWYAQGKEIAREVTKEVAAAIVINPPQTVVDRPQEYARQQHDRVVATVAPRMEALAQRAAQLSHQVERQELQITAMAQREQAAKAILAHLRQVDLGTVMTALGGEPDRDDRHKWHLGAEVIFIKGEQFDSALRQRGGSGAIDLVMHARSGYGFNEAIVFLRDHLGPDVAVVAAARHAQTIAEREPALWVPERIMEQNGQQQAPVQRPRPLDREAGHER